MPIIWRPLMRAAAVGMPTSLDGIYLGVQRVYINPRCNARASIRVPICAPRGCLRAQIVWAECRPVFNILDPNLTDRKNAVFQRNYRIALYVTQIRVRKPPSTRIPPDLPPFSTKVTVFAKVDGHHPVDIGRFVFSTHARPFS